ncbi:hypothetical protein LCGC14_2479010 [marine sediment metagenome]|uniref:Uncharacterized protein n=1 Tax=marine sediment metagenome TaxID=412755 RepID=A0A0F9E1T5_9ZZZZ
MIYQVKYFLLHYKISESGGDELVINFNTNLTANTRRFIGVTYDGSTNASGAKAFVNAVEAEQLKDELNQHFTSWIVQIKQGIALVRWDEDTRQPIFMS